MAELRLALVAVLVACAPQAAGQPVAATTASGLAAPAGWQVLPELATAMAGAAKGEGIVIEGAEAWGEPARGCYATWIALRGGEGNLLLVDDALASVAAQKIAVRDLVKPAGDGVLAFTFERAPYRGKLRAKLERGHVAALACFANDREPGSCEPACAALLRSIS